MIINRCQSKNRRLYAAAIFESIKKKVINAQSIEYCCQSKLRTLLAFASIGVKIPKTVYSPLNPQGTTDQGINIDYTKDLRNLIRYELPDKLVLKPDFGTHGLGVSLINNEQELDTAIKKNSPNLMNPSGVVAQEYIQKWFFDLRIIVSKEKNKPPICQKNALARGGFGDFRTNTFLGNMVFKAKLPEEIIKESEKSANIIGENQDAWVIGLDAMPSVQQNHMVNEELLREKFQQLRESFRKVNLIKKMPNKKQNFKEYTKAIDKAYTDYMHTKEYEYISNIVNSTTKINSKNIYFHEGNACPEFWEQTRAVAGINVAELLLSSSTSIIDR